MIKKTISFLIFLFSMFFAGPAFAHIVEQGDTMSSIARNHQISLTELAEANPDVRDIDLIFTGQVLTIPIKKKDTSTVNGQAAVSERQTGRVNDNSKKENLPQRAAKEVATEKQGFTAAELDLLARIVRAEAENQPFEGKIAVACVVLNRIDSPKFPDSMEAVIYARNQFQPVANGQVNKKADQASVQAVEAALSTHRELAGDAVFFYNPDTATNRWLDSRKTVTAIGQHVFKK